MASYTRRPLVSVKKYTLSGKIVVALLTQPTSVLTLVFLVLPGYYLTT